MKKLLACLALMSFVARADEKYFLEIYQHETKIYKPSTHNPEEKIIYAQQLKKALLGFPREKIEKIATANYITLNSSTIKNLTPFMQAFQLLTEDKEKAEEVKQQLLTYDETINFEGVPVLILATYNDDAEAIKNLLDGVKVGVNVKYNNMTALILAAKEGKIEATKALLAATTIKVDAQDEN